MNFYASAQYLQVVAEVYFHGMQTRIADVEIGGQVLRLLIVDERRAVTQVPFLDYHQPLRRDEFGKTEKIRAYAPWVAQGVVARKDRKGIAQGLGLAPYVDWSSFPTYDDFAQSMKVQHRRRVRNAQRLRRRLEESRGPLEFLANDSRSDVLDFALRWKSWQFETTGIPDLFADRRNVHFFEALQRDGLLMASTLRAGGELLAVWLGVVHDAVWSGWVFTYDRDPSLRQYSIGHHLLRAMLRHSKTVGHREFDFSVGDQDYKWLYATHARILGPLGRPPSAGVRDIAVEALRRVHLLDTARSLRRGVRRLTGH